MAIILNTPPDRAPGRLLAFAFALVAVALAALGCDRPETDTVAERSLPFVEVVAARRGPIPEEVVAPGVARARNQVSVRPEISGRLVEVLVESGETVRAGQPLVKLDAEAPRERLRQAEADVRLARAAEAAARARAEEMESRVERIRALADQSLVSAQDLESAEAELAAGRANVDESSARIEQAEATVEERRSDLDRTVVRSPVSGRIGGLRAEIGMQVGPDTTLVVAGDPSAAIIDVDLAEPTLAKVEVGQPVEVRTRDGSPPLAARLTRVSPFLDEESFTAAAEIEIENANSRLRPGTFVEVRILVGGGEEFTLVPVAALRRDEESGESGVFVVDRGDVRSRAEDDADHESAHPVSFRAVEVVAAGRGQAGVRGLDEGSWVVTLGQHLLEASSGESASARVRTVAWERVLELQQLQDEDLLDAFLAKQRKIAAVLGAEIPESEDEVERVLAGSAPTGSDGVK